MARAKKSQPDPEADPKTPQPDEAAGVDAESAGRPSQLDQIRAAINAPVRARADDAPELPGPEAAPELPAGEVSGAPELEAPAAAPELMPPADAPELPAPEADAAPAEEPATPAPPAPAAPPAVVAPPAAHPTAPWVPPPTHPPAQPATPAVASPRPQSTLAVGVVLVVLGAFFLVVRIFDIDLSTYGWPLFVIIPGLTLLVVGFASLGTGALVPGGIVTMAGLVLAYQNATGDWPSWAYAWALVLIGGVGIGLFLQGLRDHNAALMRRGRSVILWSALIFMIGFVFFESILNVSGMDYGIVGRAALPALLIVIGVMLLARNFQRGRSA